MIGLPRRLRRQAGLAEDPRAAEVTTTAYRESEADRRYRKLFDALRARMGDDRDLFEFDEVVGRRLSEATEAGLAGPHAYYLGAGCICEWWDKPSLQDDHNRLLAGDEKTIVEMLERARNWTHQDYGDDHIDGDALVRFIHAHNWSRPVMMARLAESLEEIIEASATKAPPIQRACSCRWADYPDHDTILRMETDLDAFVDLVDHATQAGTFLPNGDQFGTYELDDFVAEHNWIDPVRMMRVARGIADIDRMSVDISGLTSEEREHAHERAIAERIADRRST